MNRKQLELYFIMGTSNVKNLDPLSVLESALQAGITFFQFREKGSSALKGSQYEEFARECQALCRKYHVPFIVNDDIELALKLDADGVHVGQDDLAVEKARKLAGDKILGVSVHNLDELEEAIRNKADYIGVGPIYKTKSKADAKQPAGTKFLQQASSKYPSLPIVAIGGISSLNCHESIEVGADGVAVISAICESANIHQTVNEFKQKIKEASKQII